MSSWRLAATFLVAWVPVSVWAQAGSANPGAGPSYVPPPPAAQQTSAPSRVPGPAVHTDEEAPKQADYHRQAAELYRQAAEQCPPRAPCYKQFESYQRCLAGSFGGGAGCNAPSCSITSPPCSAGGTLQYAPASAGSGSVQSAVQTGFSNLASTLMQIEDEREAREAAVRDAQARQDAKAQGLLPKWRYYAEQLNALHNDPETRSTDYQLSPEHHALIDNPEYVSVDADGVVRNLENEGGDIVSEFHQKFAIEDDPQFSRGVELELDAFRSYKQRVLIERAERSTRLAAMAARTTHLPAPQLVADGLTTATLLPSRGGAPLWLDGKDGGVFTVGPHGPVRLFEGQALGVSAADARDFYTVRDQGLHRAPLAGGKLQKLMDVPCSPLQLFVDDTQVFGLCVDTTTWKGSLWRAPKAGNGRAEMWIPPTDGLTAVSFGDASVLWTVMGTAEREFPDASIVAAAKTGGAPFVVSASESLPGPPAEADGVRYWSHQAISSSNGDGQIMVSRGGAAPQVLLDDVQGPIILAVRDGYLYWAEAPPKEDLNAIRSTLKRMSLADGNITVIAEGLHGGVSVAVTDGAIFYAESGSSVMNGDKTTFLPDGKVWRVDLPKAETKGSVIVAGATVASPAPGCVKDTECKGERICEAGKCVEPVRKKTKKK